MNDDYLWDGSGEPDPEIQRLESVLGRFRHNRPVPEFPEHVSLLDWLRSRVWLPRLAAVAAAVLTVVGGWMLIRQRKPSMPAWEVARLAGSPRVNGKRIGETGRLATGQRLETDASSRAILNVSAVGQVQVDPDTRIRLVETRSTQHRMALEHGTIHVMIWAPPGQFVVETPSAAAIDLGCAYTLQVDDKGAGLVRVTFGWVGFRLNGRESFIPEGALCATRPGAGPGTPYYEDAPATLRAALGKLDFDNAGPESRARALGTVLTLARQRDALTLWHLLSRVSDSERGRVYDRLAALVPPPAGVTRAGILDGDKTMRDLWWNALGLGDTTWWRVWERAWQEQTR